MTRKEILKDDSPEENIPSEKAVKKIHEAGNCELHEIQQRTDKVQWQRCYSYIEAGFQVCPCGGQPNMSEEMLSSIRQKFYATHCRCLHDIPRNARRHGAQPWHKHHFLAKEFLRKIGEKGIYLSILDRFQNDEVFHASQLHKNWTIEWCEYLDYIRTIGISHRASPEQLERYAALYHFRYDPKHSKKEDTIKSRPDYHQTTRAIGSMNKEAGQIQEPERRHNYREDLDPEKLDWLFLALSQLEMVLHGKPNLRF